MARYYRGRRGGYGRRRFGRRRYGFRRSFRRFRTRYRTIFRNRYRTRFRRGRTRYRVISRPQGLFGTVKYLVVILLVIFGGIFVWNKYLKGKIIKV
jgi:hypothetical protein